ncbi:HNH endonuclease signature motif containing protein [Spiroplasma endosymbiont of Amphibalanus improvisus]|uniref:HNH endonuclease signature motif containing protein n=1 Tax=Spiroplasma endosymbiont of Amphibalanus improvisus TaxID=3066327 RepID=UPI00313D7B3F
MIIKQKLENKIEILKNENNIKKINNFNNETLDILLKKYNLTNSDDKRMMKQELRRIYSASVEKYCNLKLISKPSIDKNITITEKCHIISFEHLFKNRKYKEAISPFNVLFLNPDLHKFYDNNYLTFNPLEQKIELTELGRNKDDISYYNDKKINVNNLQLEFIEKNYNIIKKRVVIHNEKN